MTGNVRRFVERTGRPAVRIPEVVTVCEPFVIVTPTVRFGEVPAPVALFLRDNGGLLRGVAASGNRNFGAMFTRAADVIAAQYNVPILARFELAGTDEDVREFNEGVTRIGEAYRT